MPRWSRPAPRADKYKSSLEAKVAKQIRDVTGKPDQYETTTIEYVKPAKTHRYRPDFVLPNNIIIETKGIWDAEDREKHLLVRQQFPHLDIRMVFSRMTAPIYPKAKTSMEEYCIKHGIPCAEREIPAAWFREKPAVR